jgi:hypothetical protein
MLLLYAICDPTSTTAILFGYPELSGILGFIAFVREELGIEGNGHTFKVIVGVSNP